MSIGLSAYTIRLRKRHSHEKEWLTMSQGGAVDAWDFLHRHLLNLKNKVVDLRGLMEDGDNRRSIASKAFRLDNFKANKSEGTFCGVVETGDYGTSSPIRDVKSGALTHRKKRSEAEMPPYYFRIHIPNGSTAGVMVLQRTGIHGLKGSLEFELTRYFATLNYTARIATLTDRDLLNTYLTHGDLEEIRVLTHSVPSDPRAAIRNTKINGERISPGTRIEILLTKDNGFGEALKTAAAAFRQTKNARDLVEIYGLDNPEEVSFVVDMNGVKKTFKIIRPSEIGIKYDISDGVQFDGNNHPTFQSIDPLAAAWCTSLMRQLSTSNAH